MIEIIGSDLLDLHFIKSVNGLSIDFPLVFLLLHVSLLMKGKKLIQLKSYPKNRFQNITLRLKKTKGLFAGMKNLLVQILPHVNAIQ